MVKAVHYMRLMRDLDRGTKNLPLLKRMIADVEDTVWEVYRNTVAWGHTQSTPVYPCQKCREDMILGEGDNDETFTCEYCGETMTYDELAVLIADPKGEGRGVKVSDCAELILSAWITADRGETFREKFPYFEQLIEYWHRSGDISHWFIEGGRHTIDKYRSSKLPHREWNEIAEYSW